MHMCELVILIKYIFELICKGAFKWATSFACHCIYLMIPNYRFTQTIFRTTYDFGIQIRQKNICEHFQCLIGNCVNNRQDVGIYFLFMLEKWKQRNILKSNKDIQLEFISSIKPYVYIWLHNYMPVSVE